MLRAGRRNGGAPRAATRGHHGRGSADPASARVVEHDLAASGTGSPWWRNGAERRQPSTAATNRIAETAIGAGCEQRRDRSVARLDELESDRTDALAQRARAAAPTGMGRGSSRTGTAGRRGRTAQGDNQPPE